MNQFKVVSCPYSVERSLVYERAGIPALPRSSYLINFMDSTICPITSILFSYTVESESAKFNKLNSTAFECPAYWIMYMMKEIRLFEKEISKNIKQFGSTGAGDDDESHEPTVAYRSGRRHGRSGETDVITKNTITIHKLLNNKDQIMKIRNGVFLGARHDGIIFEEFAGVQFLIVCVHIFDTNKSDALIPVVDFVFESVDDANTFTKALPEYIMERMKIVRPVIMDVEKVLSSSSRSEIITYHLTVKTDKDSDPVSRNEDSDDEVRASTRRRRSDKSYGKCKWVQTRKPILGRGFNSIYLPKQIKENIIRELDDFFDKDSQAFYEEHNINKKKNFLFYGRPGTGKSSLIRAIAESYDLGISIMSLSDHGMTDEVLKDAFSSIPKNTILILEEVDSYFDEKRESKMHNTLTFGSLLDSIDGMCDMDNQIIIMTTNHKDKLSAAQIRNGRIDYSVAFDYMVLEQAIQMTQSFYKKDSQELIENFAKAYINKYHNTVPAHLQSIFVCYRKIPLSELFLLIKNNQIDENLQVTKNTLNDGNKAPSGLYS